MLQSEGTPKSVICMLVCNPAWAAIADAAAIFRVSLTQCLVPPASLGTPAVLTRPAAGDRRCRESPSLAGSWGSYVEQTCFRLPAGCCFWCQSEFGTWPSCEAGEGEKKGQALLAAGRRFNSPRVCTKTVYLRSEALVTTGQSVKG